MNRRPHRPFFVSFWTLINRAIFFVPLSLEALSFPGWGPLHVSSNWMCSLQGNAMGRNGRHAETDSKIFQAFPTHWMAFWLLVLLMFRFPSKWEGWSRQSISRMTFRGSPWNQVRYCVDLRIFRMMIWTSPGGLSDVRACGAPTQSASKWSAPKHLQLGGCIDAQFLRPYCTHIASYRYHKHERRNQLTWSTHVQHVPALKAKKDSKKGGNGWWLPYVSLIGWLVNVFKSLLNSGPLSGSPTLPPSPPAREVPGTDGWCQ